jgi:hypothetical protein
MRSSDMAMVVFSWTGMCRCGRNASRLPTQNLASEQQGVKRILSSIANDISR